MAEVQEAPFIKSMESTMKDFPQSATYMKGADIRDFRSCDTGYYQLPGLELFTGAQPVDSIRTKGGRQFELDKNGVTTYKVTSKDNKGLYDITRDYMTARDGKQPTPEQIRTLAEQVAKDNGIRDINNIRQGTTLRFPGPERTPVVQEQPRPHYRPGEPPRDRTLPTPREVPAYTTRPGEPPSKDFKDATGLNIYRRKEEVSFNFDGTTTKTFNGAIRDGDLGLGRTQVWGHEKTDRSGKVIETQVNMMTPKEFKVPKPGGGEETVSADKMRVVYSPDGSYHTQLTKPDGTTVSFRTDKNGRQDRTG